MSKAGKVVSGEIAAQVKGERLWDRLMALAEFGASDGGAIDRQALSDQEIPARAQVVRWGEALGLEALTDAAANLFLRHPGAEPDLPPVLVGSHIDTQPTGGKFDGALGVLAGLEAVEAIVARGVRPRRTIEVVAWMNEEGSRFVPGMMGSAVFCGVRKLEDILNIRDKAGTTVEIRAAQGSVCATTVAAASVRVATGSLSRSAYRAGSCSRARKEDHRHRHGDAGQTDISRRGGGRGEPCRHLAAQRAARRAGFSRQYCPCVA